MWQLFLLAAIGAGTGYVAGCMKQKKRETSNCFPQKKEEVKSCLLNSPYNTDIEEARIVAEHCQKPQGDLWLNYGVGIGVMVMISTGKQKIDELSLLIGQTADLLQELKGQVNANKNYMKNADVFMSICHQNILAFQEDKLRTDVYRCVNSGSGSVGTPSEENAYTRSVITNESIHHLSGMVELDKEYQAMLENTQINFVEPNFSNHQRNMFDLSESSSIAMVEGGLCANGLTGHHSSSENKSPMEQLKISDVDNYGVSPYELDRHLRDLFEKQQEEKISELGMQLKSMETKLCAKEGELQQWKDRVRCLAEHSFGITSGEDSSSFEKASNPNGRRQYLMPALSNSSSKSFVGSAQEANSQLPWCPLSRCIEGPLENTADSKEQLDYSDACNYAGLNSLVYAEGTEMPA
ncbi:hypothetical protein SUGI_0718720 [Cryptomeria japonica]|nr:hypothetical protein SUGI_0718720 [Cryptomeria japonica]